MTGRAFEGKRQKEMKPKWMRLGYIDAYGIQTGPILCLFSQFCFKNFPKSLTFKGKSYCNVVAVPCKHCTTVEYLGNLAQTLQYLVNLAVLCCILFPLLTAFLNSLAHPLSQDGSGGFLCYILNPLHPSAFTETKF